MTITAVIKRVSVTALLCLTGIASATLQADSTGERLYQRHCAACHGFNGYGGAGVPLALPSFLNDVTDDYLEKTIRLGRPGRVMPTFRQLSEKEVALIISHIRSWQPGSGASLPATDVKGDPRHGKQLYQQYCASCHGVKGEGGRGTGVTKSRPRELPIMAPALNNTGFLQSASDQMIKRTLVHGREGTPMNSYLKQGLSEQDINDVVSYVRSFEAVKESRDLLKEDSRTVLIEETDNDFESTIQSAKRAIIGKNFRIIRQQFLNSGMVASGKEDADKVIIYFCNFKFLNDALLVDPRVGLFLPCRITIVKHKDKVKLMAINPLLLSGLFNNRELDLLCDEMYKVYTEILDEATL